LVTSRLVSSIRTSTHPSQRVECAAAEADTSSGGDQHLGPGTVGARACGRIAGPVARGRPARTEATMGDRLIFQLGTNNWQRGGEFAPGSGILHEAHHHAYNALPGM